MAIAVVTAVVAGPMVDWRLALGWIVAYGLFQVLDCVICPSGPETGPLPTLQTCVAVAVIFVGNVIFGALGLMMAMHAGVWGLPCACLMWSGSFVHNAIGYTGSPKALIACGVPEVGFLLTVPFLIAHNGGPPIYGVVLVVAGLLHGMSMLELWSVAAANFEVERRERLATHVARHDPETGLANRLAFEEAIAAAKPACLVVAVLEIDRFADLRRAIGYALVARLVIQITSRLEVIHEGLIGHLSEASLGVMFHVATADDARAYAARLQAAMTHPIAVDGIGVDVGLTIGIAIHIAGEVTGTLLEHASIAVGVARRSGARIGVFEASRRANPAGNLSLMSDMLRSIANGDITNHYQPKYDLRSGELVAVEALVRWQHPERGAVAPDEFIPLAEETGRIRELTLDVLSRSVRDQASLAQRGYKLSFAVNLSGRLLDDPDFIRTIIEIAHPAAARISMEVTETAMMSHPETALALLGRLRTAGIGVAIDDYGSGLSSLAYLKNIPADELKIDKSFVTHMDRSREDCLLVRSTIALAHSFGLLVVAEGVESSRTLEILGQMNCDQAQGYHMARPMPLAKLIALLEGGSRLATGSFALAVGGLPGSRADERYGASKTSGLL